MEFKQYPSYKDSGIEWLGEVPEHWSVTPIKRLGMLKGGAGFPHSEQGISTEEFDFHKVNSLGRAFPDGSLRRSENTVSRFIANKLGAYIFPVGTIVFAKVGAALFLGRIRQLARKACLDNNMMGLVINQSKFDVKFINYAMNLIRFDLIANPGAIPSVNEYQIGNFSLVLPSIHQQTQIVTYLDTETSRIDNLIANQEKLIELLEEQRKAIISHAVTKGLEPNAPMKDSGVEWLGEVPEHWRIIRLNEAAKIVRGNSAFSKGDLLENGQYVALQYGRTYKVNEINDSFISYVNQEFFKPNQVAEIEDTILISTSETIEDLGHSCFYNRQDIGLIGGEQFLLKPNKDKTLGKYLYYSSKAFSRYLQKYATGLKVYRFNSNDLKTVYIPEFSQNEQQQIVSFLDAENTRIDNLIDKQKSLIERLKEYRASVISHAVTGKIDVRNITI